MLNVFQLFDEAAAIYRPFMFSTTVATFVRELSYLLEDARHEFSINGQDLKIFHVGTYDQRTGVFAPFDDEHRIFMSRVSDYAPKKSES